MEEQTNYVMDLEGERETDPNKPIISMIPIYPTIQEEDN